MNQPDQAGQETAALTSFQVHPVAALTEANALVGFLQNRNLLLAHDVLSLKAENEGYRQQIDDLVAKNVGLEGRIADLNVVPDEPPVGEE